MKKFYIKLILTLCVFALLPQSTYALVPSNGHFWDVSEVEMPTDVCDNVTESGEIGSNQTNAGGFIPETIESITPASGGTGPIQYVWITRLPVDVEWTMIPGAIGESYSPSYLSETTLFRRCARNVGCDAFDGESNDITITITDPDPLEVDEFNDCSAEGGVEYSVQIEGMLDAVDLCMTVDDITGMVSMYVEVWLQNIDCPGSELPETIEIEADGVSYTAEGVIAEQTTPGGAVEKIYRVLVTGVTEEVCVVDADLCDVISTALYVKRTSEEHSSSSFKTYNRELYENHTGDGLDDCISDVLLVGESLIARDIEIYIPIHEKDGSRSVSVSITVTNDAGITVASSFDTFTEQNAGDEASLYEIILPAVPGDGTHVEIEVCSPDGTGDSFGIGAVALTTMGGCVTCEDYEVTVSTITDISCFGETDGAITFDFDGGEAPYTYEWSNGATTASISGLDDGTYTVTITDANECTGDLSFEVTEPSLLIAEPYVYYEVNCETGTGKLASNASGGTTPYTYLWSDGQTGQYAYTLLPGDYTITVTDANGCVVESDITLSPPPCCNVTDAGEIAEDQENCGPFTPATITSVEDASGGIGPIEYVWISHLEGEGWAMIPGADESEYSPGLITETTYFRRCARNAGCDDFVGESNDIVITIHDEVEIDIASEDVDCDTEESGTATITITSGTSPYTYLWSDGQTTFAATGLGAGDYTVIVTDANGCEVEGEVSIATPPCCNVTDPGEIAEDQENCGPFTPAPLTSVEDASGGIGPIEYLWIYHLEGAGWITIPDSDDAGYAPGLITETTYFRRCARNAGCDEYAGETDVVVITINPIPELTITSVDVDCDGGETGSATAVVTGGTAPYTYLWSDGQTTATAVDLAPGDYSVTITDDNDCTVEGEITIEGYDALVSSISSDDISCYGGDNGSATVTVSGGLAPYSYEWSDGQTTATASDLSAGTYTVTVTDANGCTTEEEIEITAPEGVLAILLSADGIDCLGGTVSATAIVTGGTAPYTYLWSDGQTTATATGLVAGTYSLTVTDANGCTKTDEIEIEITDGDLATTVSGDAIDCFGGTSSATATVTGGTPPYSYEWSDGQTTATATDLSAGTYTVEITDDNGCTISDEIEITEPDAELLTTMSGDAIDCFGGTSSATVSATGGTAPYTYEWSDGQTTATATDLTVGTYTVTVTDANGCTTTDEIEITAPDAALSTTMSGDAIDCFGGSASATVTATGGTAPYSYEWSDGQTTATATGLSAGTYTVTITDANGCTTTDEIEITQPDAALATTMTGDAVECFGGSATATVTATGGTAPYSYEWSDGQTTATATGLSAGTYTVTLTDANGCTTTDEIEITMPDGALATAMSGDAIDCFGGSASATVTVTGGTAPYTYEWSDGQTTATATDLSAGTYTVEITDDNGCTISDEIEITEPDAELLTAMSGDAIDCFGGTSSATVTVTGGTAPYTYEWSDGQTTATATGLTAGTYTVTITDANGCTTTDEIEITAPDAALATTMSGDAIDCFGGTSSATVTATGGTAPYSYEWSDGQTTATATDLTVGTYTVTITDANGCTTTDEIEITTPDGGLATTMSGDAIDCSGGTSSATVTVTGGTPPYSYEWSDGQTTATATDLTVGTYTVTVTDANGCTTTDEIEITAPDAALATTMSGDAIDCFGGTSSATVTATGGTAPYTYEWSDGQTTATATDLTVGTYTVTVTDANGCTTTDEIEITAPDAALATTMSGDAIDCFGGTSSATVTATGGTAPYSYEWSDGQTTAIATGLSAGTYTVTITDANGCTTTDEIEITQPDAALATTMTGDAVECFGGSATATVTATGGTAPYTYEWSDGQTTATATDLTVGTYTVTVTDANGCTTTDEIEITAPDAALATTMSGDAIDCFGGSASATVTATGGTAPYTYEWSDGQTTATASDLSAGTYTVTVTDANGCTTTDEIEITQPDAALATTMTGDAVECFGGSATATVTATGGTAPYTYEWSDGQTTATATGLGAGTYTVTVTDANGCTTTDEIEITTPDGGLATTMSGDAIDCFGGTSSATVTATGGTAPYTYEWSDGQTTATATDLSAGTYSVEITDDNGCTTTDEIEITAPDAALATTMSGDAIDCFGGTSSATVTATGGTAPYTYEWSDGQTTATATDLTVGTYTVTVTDANGCTTTDEIDITAPDAALATTMSGDAIDCFGGTSSATVTATGGTALYTYEWSDGQTTATATGLTAGTYTVTVTDANGCTTTDEIEITGPDAALATTMSGDAIDCFGGTSSATVTATGGTAPYTYEWSDGQTTATATGLTVGTYTVTVTDANGCTTTDEIEITQPDAALATTMSGDAIDCFGGTSSATVAATGGTAPYTYEWSDGQTTATATGLTAGTYTVTVTDANGCTTTDEIEITGPDAALATTMSGDAIDCFGGTSSATVTVTGGTAPYTYEWSDGQTTATATGLTVGTYTVTVTDANGCTTTDEIEITQPDAALATTMSGDAIDCFGGTSSATVTATGGTAPYTYEWSDGQTTATATDLTVGTYTVTITDANGCTTTDEIEVTAPDAALATAMSGDAIDCFGGTSSATVTATGGTAPYTYEWSDGQTTATATGLTAGTYTVTVTDANGCTTTDEIEITMPDGALATAMSGDAIDCFGGTSSATVTVTGGTPPYSYEWSDGQTTATATDLSAGIYTVTVTDANGCTTTDEIEITGPDAALATTMSGDAIDCFGGTSSATVTVTGGTAPYTYEWSDGQTAASATGLTAGTYTVTVTDANGCTTTDEIEITEPDAALATAMSGDAIDCFGGTSSATVTATGGTAPYTYEWSDGQTTATATGLTAGTYTVTVTDANGCTTTDEIEITGPDAALATTMSGDAIDCFGGTSSATVTVTGGTAPYTYEWSDGQTTATATGLTAGTYTVTVTDANGCTTTDEIEITEPDGELAATFDVTDVNCFGGTDGGAEVIVTGGTGPYEYFWYYMEIGEPVLDGVPAGTYTVVITDANGCELTTEVTISEPDEIEATFEVSDVSCFGGTDGSATVTATGGTAPYEYFWYYMEIGVPSITDAPAGTYTVVITDANGCEATAEVTIGEPAEALTATITSVGVDCFGDTDGSAAVTATGGTPAYTYEWSDGQITATATGLGAGTYTVTVTDANGCTTTEEVTITGPDAGLAVTFTTAAVGCFGDSDGSATATVTGGTAPYTYEWSDGQTTATATGLSADLYTVTVTDAAGCTITEEVEITEPDAPLSATFDVTDATCFGGTDGSISVIVAGGTGPYEYFWYYMEIGVPEITDAPAGTYTVVITDANGCELITEGTIGEPDEIEATFEVSDVSCFGGTDGSATVTATGGTAPYEYFWYYMEIGVPSITDAPAGTYTVVITDANGCESTAEVTIGEPTDPISSSFTTTMTTCFVGDDGSATVTATGGTAPYTYEWSDGQTGPTATDLSAGTITCTIMDANGCIHDVEVEIAAPDAITADFSVTDVTCFGGGDGSATAIAIGGTAPFTYGWSDGQTTVTAIDLIAGTYTVTITDDNGCIGTAEVIVGEPDELTLEMSSTDVSCFGGFDGTTSVIVTGGTAPYEYFWYFMETEVPEILTAPAGTYIVIITDANGCTATGEVTVSQPDAPISATVTTEGLTCSGGDDGSATVTAVGGTPGYTYLWSDGQTTVTATGLSGDTYTVTITDANGCTHVEEVEIIEPEAMEITFLITDVTCFGEADGTVMAIVSGGTAPYIYEWSDGQTTETAVDLIAGTYTVTVYDANGCMMTSGDAVVEDGAIITLETTTFIGEICDGMVSVTPSGGTAPYTYDWAHGATEAALTGLCEGVYTVTVTDANGCTATADIVVAFSIMGIGITVSPNPVSDVARISIQTEGDTEIYVDVLNTAGQEVKDNLFSGKTDESGIVVIDFSTSYLERGMYFVRVQTINGFEVETIIVQ